MAYPFKARSIDVVVNAELLVLREAAKAELKRRGLTDKQIAAEIAAIHKSRKGKKANS